MSLNSLLGRAPYGCVAMMRGLVETVNQRRALIRPCRIAAMAARTVCVEGDLTGLGTGGELRNLHLQVGAIIWRFDTATTTRNKYD
jgi:hypothetical protein